MSELEKIKSGELYVCNSEELVKMQVACLENLYELNATRPSELEKRTQLYKKVFAEAGENLFIELPIRCNWGINTHWGNNCYANYNLVLVDDADIFIGDNVMIAPNVVIATGTHPICPELREQIAQFNLPVVIERNVWIGAGAIILPGVTVGENSVIGAGSVVTKNVPSNVVAYGNPCKVIREISQRDREFYYKERRITPLKNL